MIENPALSMLKWRESKRMSLKNRVEEATTRSHTAEFLESLTAAGVSLTNFTLINAQKRDFLVASVSASADCVECSEGCQCGEAGPDGVYEVRKGTVRRLDG